ncbi:MAG: PaaI family thioesterase [Candidatus Phaeomarinobacter sp.]
MTEARNSLKGDSERPALPSPRPDQPLDGYAPMELRDPFEAFMGPFYSETAQNDGLKRKEAFIVDDRHVDADGKLHPGMLMTFADAIVGGTAWNSSGRRPCVTLSMQTSYTGIARAGDLVIGHTRLTRKTRAVVFCAADFFVGDELICQSTSLWKVLGEH